MSLSKMLQEYREGLRGLPTYDELAAIASSAPMTQECFNEKMDALDKVNPEPLARLMAATEQCADPIVESNVSLLRQRSAVGVQKYGTTLADNKLPLRAWLNHALEEALDQANYLQAAMAEIDEKAVATHKHIKSGGTYELLHDGLMEGDLQSCAVYRCLKTGQVWVRPAVEFAQKFTQIYIAKPK